MILCSNLCNRALDHRADQATFVYIGFSLTLSYGNLHSRTEEEQLKVCGYHRPFVALFSCAINPQAAAAAYIHPPLIDWLID
jgi:hypothetical protein